MVSLVYTIDIFFQPFFSVSFIAFLVCSHSRKNPIGMPAIPITVSTSCLGSVTRSTFASIPMTILSSMIESFVGIA
jgi:hypothetical protein